MRLYMKATDCSPKRKVFFLRILVLGKKTKNETMIFKGPTVEACIDLNTLLLRLMVHVFFASFNIYKI